MHYFQNYFWTNKVNFLTESQLFVTRFSKETDSWTYWTAPSKFDGEK